MNLLQLRNAVLARAQVAPSDAALSLTNLNQWINDAVQFISVEHDWPWLQTSTTFATVGRQAGYTVPANWMQTISMRIAGYNEIEPRSSDELVDINVSDEAGLPQYYAIYADGILLAPVPDGVYTVTHRFLKQEAVLSADGDTPTLPAQFHGAVVRLAASYALASDRETARAAAAMDEYRQWKMAMQGNARRSRPPGKIRVRNDDPVYGGW